MDRGYVILGTLTLGLVFGAAALSTPKERVAPASQTVIDRLGTEGQRFTTSDALDCYGDEQGAARSVGARFSQDETGANDVRIAELARSQGYTLDAHQPYVVVQSDNQYERVRVEGGTFDRFECWVYVRDAALVSN